MVTTDNFTYEFTTHRAPHDLYDLLLDVPAWWSGLFNETIKGESMKVGDEFTFHAGDGMHYSKQRLVVLIPDKRMSWLVVESKLIFLEDPSEWNNSHISFDLISKNGGTLIRFMHEGLVPEIACYQDCSSAWLGYLAQLERRLNTQTLE